jgi:YfiH family protein
LNLGGSEDDPENIRRNRQLALDEFKLSLAGICNLKQVHGKDVKVARPVLQQGDALVSNEKGLILAVSIADCYPILYHDPVNNVIGAAHAGWRGTEAGIAAEVVTRMTELGANKENIKVGIGAGITRDKFEVGHEVIEKFLGSGFPQSIIHGNKIDLVEANKFVLQKAGINSANISSLGRSTFEDDFFSYRRDKGVTGRMWGIITLT